MKQTFFHELETIEQERRDDAERAYRDLVCSCASDVEVDPAEAIAVVERSGRTISDLNEDVHKIIERRLLAESIAGEAEALAELREVEDELNRLLAEFEDARKQYDRARMPLAERAAQLHQTTMNAKIAERQLVELADPEVKAAMAELRARQEILGQKRSALKREIDAAQGRHEINVANGTTEGESAQVAKLAGQMEATEEELQQVRDRYAELLDIAKQVD